MASDDLCISLVEEHSRDWHDQADNFGPDHDASMFAENTVEYGLSVAGLARRRTFSNVSTMEYLVDFDGSLAGIADDTASPRHHNHQLSGMRSASPQSSPKRGRADSALSVSSQKRGRADSALSVSSQHSNHGGTTLNETALNTALSLVGAGVLEIPYAFGQTGLVSAIFLPAVAVVTLWTALLIGRLMGSTKPLMFQFGIAPNAHDWPFLGFVAFGDFGRALCSLIFVAEIFTGMIAFLVINGTHFNLLFPHILSRSGGIILSGSISFILLFPSAKLLAYLSAFGIISTVMGAASLVWSAAAMPELGADKVGWTFINNADSIPMALGIFQFCVVTHSIIPSIYRGMENPRRDFSGAMKRAFCFAGIFYTSVGLFGYWTYASYAKQTFMENLGKNLDLSPLAGLAFLYVVSTVCFIINLQATFPILAMGLIAATESFLKIWDKSIFLRTSWKAFLMMLCIVIGVVLQDCMAPVTSLVGCLSATFTCFVLPLTFTMKLCETNFTTKVVIGILLVYSVYILVSGTYANIANIVTELTHP